MYPFDFINCFELDNDLIFNQQIGEIFADDLVLVFYFYGASSSSSNAPLLSSINSAVS